MSKTIPQLSPDQFIQLTQLLKNALLDLKEPPKKWLTRKEASLQAGISLRTLDQRCADGVYTVSKGPGKTSKVYVLRSDVERLIEKNRHVRTPYKPHKKPHTAEMPDFTGSY